MSIRDSLFSALTILFMPFAAIASDAELQRFQGQWEVIELVEDGHVIPAHSIADWLPSGGRLEIVDDAIISVSPESDRKEVKLFSIDATQYPKGIEIRTRDRREVWGIYRFDAGRLIVCLVDHEDGNRPDTFSAKEGSRRMLMTLRSVGGKVAADEHKPGKTEKSEPAVPSAEVGSARLASDAELTKMLGDSVWKYKDANGALVITLKADSRFSTSRESTQMRLFQKVFVTAPISSGDWKIQNGKLWLHVRSSVDPTRVNSELPFTLRVVTEKDLIFVDYVGHVSQAVRI